MKSAIRIPSSNLQPSLYISRYVLSLSFSLSVSRITDSRYEVSRTKSTLVRKTNRARENCEELLISGYIRETRARVHVYIYVAQQDKISRITGVPTKKVR